MFGKQRQEKFLINHAFSIYMEQIESVITELEHRYQINVPKKLFDSVEIYTTEDYKQKFEEKWNLNFLEHFDFELEQLKGLAEDKLVQWDESTLTSTPLGQFFLRLIAMVFDSYLSEIKNQAKTPVFSKTV